MDGESFDDDEDDGDEDGATEDEKVDRFEPAVDDFFDDVSPDKEDEPDSPAAIAEDSCFDDDLRDFLDSDFLRLAGKASTCFFDRLDNRWDADFADSFDEPRPFAFLDNFISLSADAFDDFTFFGNLEELDPFLTFTLPSAVSSMSIWSISSEGFRVPPSFDLPDISGSSRS